jgi:hypothetical protein
LIVDNELTQIEPPIKLYMDMDAFTRTGTQEDDYLEDDEVKDYARISELIKEILDRSQSLPHIYQTLNNHRLPEAKEVSPLSLLQQALRNGGRIIASRPDPETISDTYDQDADNHALQLKVVNILTDIAERRLLYEKAGTIPQQEQEKQDGTIPIAFGLDTDPTGSIRTLSSTGGRSSKKRKRSVLEGDDEPLNPEQELTPGIPSISSNQINLHSLQDWSHPSPQFQNIHQAIRQTLDALQNNSIDKAQIGSLQVQLHQVFLFATSSSWIQGGEHELNRSLAGYS